jgi:hypothetical protein
MLRTGKTAHVVIYLKHTFLWTIMFKFERFYWHICGLKIKRIKHFHSNDFFLNYFPEMHLCLVQQKHNPPLTDIPYVVHMCGRIHQQLLTDYYQIQKLRLNRNRYSRITVMSKSKEIGSNLPSSWDIRAIFSKKITYFLLSVIKENEVSVFAINEMKPSNCT